MKKVLVVGFGVEGQQLVDYFLKQKVDITITDQKNLKDLPQGKISKLINKVNFLCGLEYLINLKDFDLIAFSPGIKFETYHKIKNSGVPTTTQMQIFMENCKAQIIGVTGTNGKGTTSTLIYEILKAAGQNVYLGGNIGTGVLSLLSKLKKDDWVVLELSSYQLRDLTISPHIGVILNITSDHLDIHQTQENYVQSKANIVRFQKADDLAVINGDYAVTKDLTKITKAKVALFNKDEIKKLNIQLGIPGEHNYENAAAAKKVANILKIDSGITQKVLQNFKGLEHRLQKVAIVNGITFIDDSISTTPHTAIAAINTFSEPKILILGGSKKSADYSELAQEIKKIPTIKALIIIGQTGPEITDELNKINYSGKIMTGIKNIGQVVKQAFSLAEKGDIVLLSPASASFDWFKDYKDRGKKFKQAIQKLK